MGISGRKHADISADVGIPDIAVGIDSKAVRPSVVARKPECCDPTVAQAAKARTAHHSEPDCPVSGDYQAAKTCVLVRDLEIGKLAILQSADAIARNCKNHTEPSVPTATSVGTTPGRDKSIAATAPLGSIRMSLLTACSVAHTIPSAVTATP